MVAPIARTYICCERQRSEYMEPIKKAIYQKLNILDESDVARWAHTDYRVDMQTATLFREHLTDKDRVIVLGDYDCDGINASHIVRKSVKALFPNIKIDVLIPQRREGYGINQRMVDFCKDAVETEAKVAVITVDTGITAKEKLEEIKAAGCTVLLTDHHNLNEEGRLPNVDMVIDPAVTFIHNPLPGREWCGAAVAFKLFEPFLSPELCNELKCHAGLATVADVITMREGSWQLVHDTLELFHEGKAPRALNMLAMALNRDTEHLTEDDFGFYLGPAFNAPGRLYDHGPMLVLDFLTHPTGEGVEELVEINNERKSIRDEETALVFETIEVQHKGNDNPIWVYVPALHKGIVGIIASNVVERYGTSACVLTDAKNGIYTGSARAYGDFNMFEYLSAHIECFVKMGGHSGAAGFSMTPEGYDAIQKFVEPKPERIKEDVISAKLQDIPYINRITAPLRPFGTGFVEPQFRMEVDLTKSKSRLVGNAQNHLSISNFYPKYKVMHFYHEPNKLNNKNNFLARGKVHESYFKGVMTPEFNIDEVMDIDGNMSHEQDYER